MTREVLHCIHDLQDAERALPSPLEATREGERRRLLRQREVLSGARASLGADIGPWQKESARVSVSTRKFEHVESMLRSFRAQVGYMDADDPAGARERALLQSAIAFLVDGSNPDDLGVPLPILVWLREHGVTSIAEDPWRGNRYAPLASLREQLAQQQAALDALTSRLQMNLAYAETLLQADVHA